MKRRDVIKFLSAAPLAGGIIGTGLTVQPALAEEATSAIAGRDLFKELGLKTFINASCVCTTLTASLMPPEVTQAIAKGAEEFVLLNDVQDKVGAKIAELCHAEAATVTAGCWSALVQGLAGAMTGMDRKKVMQLPNVDGMKSEVILQKAHANGYHQALTNTGAKLIIVETLEEVEAAINEKTAMLWFLNRELNKGKLNYEQWLALGKKHNIPTMIDIASDAHPVENLWKFNDMGFDLVCISGGKLLRGPQSAGILMGKRDLITAARLSAPPRGMNIGRGMKVNKEEILAMYIALERYVNTDHEKEMKSWMGKTQLIEQAVRKVPGIKTEVYIPPVSNSTPVLLINWDNNKISLKGIELMEKLRKGSPSIEVMPGKNEGITVITNSLHNGQEKIVARRLFEELNRASV